MHHTSLPSSCCGPSLLEVQEFGVCALIIIPYNTMYDSDRNSNEVWMAVGSLETHLIQHLIIFNYLEAFVSSHFQFHFIALPLNPVPKPTRYYYYLFHYRSPLKQETSHYPQNQFIFAVFSCKLSKLQMVLFHYAFGQQHCQSKTARTRGTALRVALQSNGMNIEVSNLGSDPLPSLLYYRHDSSIFSSLHLQFTSDYSSLY